MPKSYFDGNTSAKREGGEEIPSICQCLSAGSDEATKPSQADIIAQRAARIKRALVEHSEVAW